MHDDGVFCPISYTGFFFLSRYPMREVVFLYLQVLVECVNSVHKSY